MQIHAILLAGGDGNRFGAEMPKQFVRLAGEQILLRSVRSVAAAGIDRLVIVVAPGLARGDRVGHRRGRSDRPDLGRGRRQDPQREHPERPPEPRRGRRRHRGRPRRGPAARAGRRHRPGHRAGRRPGRRTPPTPSSRAPTRWSSSRAIAVVEIPDRSRYRRGQTPQVFRKSVLAQAYAAAAAAGDLAATDDCSLVLRYVPGARVVAVAGDEVNLKITTRIDLVLADRMLQMRTRRADRGSASGRTRSRARGCTSSAARTGSGWAIADEARRQGAAVEVDGRSMGLDVRDYAAVAQPRRRGGGPDGRPRPRDRARPASCASAR